MTDPAGSVFISYRRSPARPAGNREAALVRDALRHVGIPTWRDLDDLDFEPAEDALVAAIDNPSLSGAVLLVTPEVSGSSIVRRVEALRIFGRGSARDGFWVLPVLIGLDYGEAQAALDSPAGFQDVGYWNMHRLDGGTVSPADAAAIARRAVKARLQAIRDRGGGNPLSIGVFARRPSAAAFSLKHDFSAHFDGRRVAAGQYRDFEKGLRAGASEVLATFASPYLTGEGMAPLPLGALVGAVYTPRAGFRLAWSQFVEGREPQRWSFDLAAEESAIVHRETKGDPASEDVVLAIGVSADIEHAAAETLAQLGVTCRAYVHCAPASGSYAPGQVLSPEQGLGFVLSAVCRVREVREDLGMRRANLHLFLACPLAMAVLLGQKLNTFSACHLYEHDPGGSPSYVRVHTFEPSNLAYGGV